MGVSIEHLETACVLVVHIIFPSPIVNYVEIVAFYKCKIPAEKQTPNQLQPTYLQINSFD